MQIEAPFASLLFSKDGDLDDEKRKGQRAEAMTFRRRHCWADV
jgi:hypothetical protein